MDLACSSSSVGDICLCFNDALLCTGCVRCEVFQHFPNMHGDVSIPFSFEGVEVQLLECCFVV